MTESLFRLLLKLTVEDPVAESAYSFRVWKSLFSVKILVFARNDGEGNGGRGLDFRFHLQAALDGVDWVVTESVFTKALDF